MRLPESGFGRRDAVGLAMTLVRTFGSRALALVDAQVSESAGQADLQARWCEVRDALAVLGEANLHMAAALDLLDQIEETSVPPMLDHAIVQLGLRDDNDHADRSNTTVAACGSAFYEAKARRHLDQAEESKDIAEKTEHLNAAARYATLHERTAKTENPEQ